MAVSVGSPSIVAEITRTSGLGPYIVSGSIARAGKFSQFYSAGDTFDYFCDDGGGRAEYGQGLLNADGSISRLQIYWTTANGIGGTPVSWPPTGRRFLRVVLSVFGGTGGGGGGGGGGGTPSFSRTIDGFWNGTVPALTKIERYLFAENGQLRAGLPGSRAFADHATSATSDSIVTQTGDTLVDELGNTLATTAITQFVVTSTGDQLVTETGDQVVDALFGGGAPVNIDIRKDGVSVGFMAFNPGAAQALFSFPSDQAFVPGDIFELVAPAFSDANLSDLVWTFLLS